MIHQLDENGTMAVVLPHGVLFRGAAEGHIRKHLIKEKNYLDAVIGLPANIFYGTSIPTCILVLKKSREHKDNILFIDASQNFGKATNQNYLQDEDLDAILEAITERKLKGKFAYPASIKEIAEDNDYNLNIPRYVDTFEDEPPVDLEELAENLEKVERAILGVDSEIKSFCSELKIKTPFVGEL